MLSHPGRANFARDAIRVFRCRELQDQDQMRVIDLRNTRGERPRVDDKLHTLPRRLHGRIGHRFAQAEVVDDNVHRSKLSRTARTCSGVIPERWPSRTSAALARHEMLPQRRVRRTNQLKVSTARNRPKTATRRG